MESLALEFIALIERLLWAINTNDYYNLIDSRIAFNIRPDCLYIKTRIWTEELTKESITEEVRTCAINLRTFYVTNLSEFEKYEFIKYLYFFKKCRPEWNLGSLHTSKFALPNEYIVVLKIESTIELLKLGNRVNNNV